MDTPPAPGSHITLWHSWNADELVALQTIITSFQEMYPDVTFDVSFIPQDELRGRYEAAVYNGRGPSLLLGPAEWGPAFSESQLVTDLTPFTSPDFLADINPAALGTGQYEGAIISLPFSQRGVLLFRNTSIISESPATFAELSAMAHAASRGGRLGSYLDRGAFFSIGHLNGLGGSLTDSNGDPTFNDSFGVTWLQLMGDFDAAGAVGMNTNRDTELFMAGRLGFVMDGSWNIPAFVDAIGEENLAIDPWPAYAGGRLSGYVQAESVFLNPNVGGQNQYAALLFMGYLLNPEVQRLLAEVGYIPSIITAQPRNVHLQQAMTAFQDGTTYPSIADQRILSAYWTALETAIVDVYQRGVEPTVALQAAYEAVLLRLEEIRASP